MRWICTILGKAGSGKTTLIRAVLPLVERPVFVLDTMGEFSEGVAFESYRDLVDFLLDRGRNDSQVYVLKAQHDTDAARFFRIFPTVKEPCTVIVDEVSKFCSPTGINDELRAIINYGRHWRQNLLVAARRAAEIHRDITAQSDCIVSFKQTEPRDIRALKQIYQEAERLPELESSEDRREFLALGDTQRLPFGHLLSAGHLTLDLIPAAALGGS